MRRQHSPGACSLKAVDFDAFLARNVRKLSRVTRATGSVTVTVAWLLAARCFAALPCLSDCAHALSLSHWKDLVDVKNRSNENEPSFQKIT